MARSDRRPHAPRPPGATTHWDHVAQWYDQLVGEEGSEYHREVVLPGVLRLLNVGPGQRVLDVACGQGVLCRLLREHGAQVAGVDASGELIRLARQRSDAAIRYVCGDARELPKLFAQDNAEQATGQSTTPPAAPGALFDAATCVLSVQNIDALPPVFEGVAGLLVPGGSFVVVMMHPCFRGPKATSWGWDAPGIAPGGAGVQYRRVDRYLTPRKEPITTHPGKDSSRYTWTFHRPLQAYVKALGHTGLLVDALEEWSSHKQSTSGPRAKAENTARREIPLFLALRAIKVVLPPAAQDGTASDAAR